MSVAVSIIGVEVMPVRGTPVVAEVAADHHGVAARIFLYARRSFVIVDRVRNYCGMVQESIAEVVNRMLGGDEVPSKIG